MLAERISRMYFGFMVEVSSLSNLMIKPGNYPYIEISVQSALPRALIEKKWQYSGTISFRPESPRGCACASRCFRVLVGICNVTQPAPKTYANGNCVSCHLDKPNGFKMEAL